MTLIDTIRTTVPKGLYLVSHSMEVTEQVRNITDRKDIKIESIVLDGYGSSRTAAKIALAYIEKMTQLPVYLVYPNNILRQTQTSKSTLYIFISESGNSGLLKKDFNRAKEIGAPTITVTANRSSYLAQNADCVIDTGCSDEAYFFHTVGHNCAAIGLMLIALRFALETGRIDRSEYDSHCNMAVSALNHQDEIIKSAQDWAKKNIGKMTDARCVIVFGSGPLYGVAEEGALKIQEVTENTIGVGYETQQRVYGATAGYNDRDFVIVLDDGENETEMAVNIARYYKAKYGNCLLVGPAPLDDTDIHLIPVGTEFRSLEFITVLQVLAYELAVSQGHEVLDAEHYDSDFFERFVQSIKKGTNEEK